MKKLSFLLIAALVLAQQQDLPFRISSNLIALPVVFIDDSGEFVDAVDSREVSLTDNGIAQRIRTFEIAPQPISMVILVDTSKRMAGVISNLRGSGILFTQMIMGETGEAAVLTYDSTVDVRQGFTTNGDLIEKAFHGLDGEREGSCLTDGVLRALGMLSSRPADRRRVIVVLGEGRDFQSQASLTRTLASAQIANVAIYTAEVSAFKALAKRPLPGPKDDERPPGADPRNRPNGVPLGAQTGASGFDPLTPLLESALALRGLWSHPLKTYAGGTGSNHINATNKRAIEDAVHKIASELHSQYWLSYSPNNLDGEAFHNIRVTVTRPGVKARYRPGYLYIPDAARQKQP